MSVGNPDWLIEHMPCGATFGWLLSQEFHPFIYPNTPQMEEFFFLRHSREPKSKHS